MIHKNLSQKIEIVKMNEKITKTNILHFVFELMKEKHNVHDERHKKDDQEPEFDEF